MDTNRCHPAASFADKSNNYLTPALAPLTKNT